MTRTKLTRANPVTCAVLTAAMVFAVLTAATTMAADTPSAASPTTQPGPGVQFTPNGSIKAVISKETTYLTEPVFPDGTIDYVTAINNKASQGVTKDNNAAVVLLEVFGPARIEEKIRAQFFKELQLPLSEQGTYFVTLDESIKSQLAAAPPDEAPPADTNSFDMQNNATRALWSAEQYPLLAKWLETNGALLDRLVDGSRRPRFYLPLVNPEDSAESLYLPVPAPLTALRFTAMALACRATLRMQAGDADGAWSDTLAVLRWGRLCNQHSLEIVLLVGRACEAVGFNASIALAQSQKLTAQQLRQMLADFDALPPLSRMGDESIAERCYSLNAAAVLQRNGTTRPIDQINTQWQSILEHRGAYHPLGEHPLVVDYNAIMQGLNRWLDEGDAADGQATYAARVKAAKALDEKSKEARVRSVTLRGASADWVAIGKLPLAEQRAKLTPLVTDYLVGGYGIIESSGIFSMETRFYTRSGMTRLALALAAYHAEHKEYPADLAALAPAYLKEIPQDLFIDQPLHYQRTDKGYLLYSVGPDMKDDAAAEKSDDIVVRKS